MDTKTWGTTRTGMIFHSFKDSGVAVCRSNIRRPEGVDSYTEAQVEARLAEAWGARVRGFRKCESCTELEAAFRDRLEASMEPSTGEGDYLPPAEDASVAPTETKTHHYNALGGQRFIEGRGWVNHCKVCQEPEGQGDHFYNKEAEMIDNDKPVRVRITLIVDVDAKAWELDYGIENRREIQNDVKEYIRNAVQCGSGGFENMTLVEAK